MWKSLPVWKKCVIGFLPLVLVVIGTNLYFNKTLATMQNTIDLLEKYDDIHPSFKQREIDHMQWAQQLLLFVFLQHNEELSLQIHPSRCELGKWLSGPERKLTEGLVPSLTEILKRIEEPHRRLHQSAVTIRELAGKGKWEEARRIVYGETLPTLEEIRMLLDLGTTEIGNAVTDMRLQADADRHHSVLVSRLTMTLGILIGLLCFLAFVLSLERPSRKA